MLSNWPILTQKLKKFYFFSCWCFCSCNFMKKNHVKTVSTLQNKLVQNKKITKGKLMVLCILYVSVDHQLFLHLMILAYLTVFFFFLVRKCNHMSSISTFQTFSLRKSTKNEKQQFIDSKIELKWGMKRVHLTDL